MATCQICGKELSWSTVFYCKYCGGCFCIQHRLPENHNCPNFSREKALEKAHYESSVSNIGTLKERKKRVRDPELIENGFGLFGLGICFAILGYGALTNPFGFKLAISIFLLIFGMFTGILLTSLFFILLALIILLLLIMLLGISKAISVVVGILTVPLIFILTALGTIIYGTTLVGYMMFAISLLFICAGLGCMFWGAVKGKVHE